jgi:hypothetical protein
MPTYTALTSEEAGLFGLLLCFGVVCCSVSFKMQLVPWQLHLVLLFRHPSPTSSHCCHIYRIDGVCFVDGVLCGCLPPTKETDFLALWAILATNNKEARSGAEFQAALAVAKP